MTEASTQPSRELGRGYFIRVQGWERLVLIGILVTVLGTWVGFARRALPPVTSTPMQALSEGSHDRWQRPDGLPLVESSARAPVEVPLRIEGPRSLRPGDRARFDIEGPQTGREKGGVLRVGLPSGTRWIRELGSACWACRGSVCRCALGSEGSGALLGLEVIRRGEHGLPLPASIRLCAEREGEGLWACRSFEITTEADR